MRKKRLINAILLPIAFGDCIAIALQTNLNGQLAPRNGLTLLLELAVAGQITPSVIIDHFVLLGATVRPLSPGKLMGYPLMLSGLAVWALNDPVTNKALNRLNLADCPSGNARTKEALNFMDKEIAEQFSANEIFDDCDPMYADVQVIAIVDTTVERIRLHPSPQHRYLCAGFLLGAVIN
ncbi:DMT family transporter [Bordetella sp. FB-8]|uniref:DMT family transporter n=1 Tax=Bordetella sp. FB-8 TaxID=1159870 RepID=UPI00037176D1|nr:DMT family transporter [Bordetella sp. FB-8]